MKKLFFLFCMSVLVITSCSDSDKADKLRLECKFDEAAALYQKAADKGDAYAMWHLSKCYDNGNGVEFSKEKAYEWLSKAAESGCEEAQADMADVLIYGYYNQTKDPKKGVKQITELASKTKKAYVQAQYAGIYWDGVDGEIEKDVTKANEILNGIKDKEDPMYLWMMGLVYCYGTDITDIDEKKAIEYWEKSMEKDGYGAKDIAYLYMYGSSEIEKDIDKAISYYQKGVKANGSGSMLDLADIYLSEDSMFSKYHDTKKGIELLKKSIRHGNGEACVRLGYYYSTGDYVGKDDKEAVKYFKLADEYGNASGSLNLGTAYLAGRSIEKDIDKAKECYERAVERGSGEAAMRLADGYAYGPFGTYDEDNYKKYLEKAVDLGNERAYYVIAGHYNDGFLYEKDKYQAFVYMKKAADAGYVDAYKSLAYMYENGVGCDKNPAKAKEWRDKLK